MSTSTLTLLCYADLRYFHSWLGARFFLVLIYLSKYSGQLSHGVEFCYSAIWGFFHCVLTGNSQEFGNSVGQPDKSLFLFSWHPLIFAYATSFSKCCKVARRRNGKTITVHIPVRLHRWKDLVLQLHNQPATSVQIYLEQFAQWCTVSGCSQRAVTDTQGTGAEPGWPGAVATHQDDKIAFLETWADLSCGGRIQNKDFPSHAETHCHLWKSIISDYFQLKNSQFYVRDIVMGFFFYVSVWRRCWSFCVIKLGNA